MRVSSGFGGDGEGSADTKRRWSTTTKVVGASVTGWARGASAVVGGTRGGSCAQRLMQVVVYKVSAVECAGDKSAALGTRGTGRRISYTLGR